MKSILRQQRSSSIIAALITMGLGLVLVLWPDHTVELICTLLGASLLLIGVFYVLGWFARRKQGLSPAIALIPGVILGGLGVWLMVSPQSVVSLVQYVFGALIIFHGIVDLQSAVALIRQKAPRWWVELALGAVTLALGALILINPFGTFATLVALIGWVLIFDGGSDLWIIYRLSKAMEHADGIIETEGRDLD